MRFLKKGVHINFMAKRKVALVFSATLVLIGLGSIAARGLHLGIDFTGGTLIEVAYEQNADIPAIREVLEKDGFGGAAVQQFGTARDVLIRLPQMAEGP